MVETVGPDSVVRFPAGWAPSERDAYMRGISNGWDSANYANAYGVGDESFTVEGWRRGQELFLQPVERRAWLLGWCLGGIRFDADQYADGSPAGNEDEPMRTDQL